MSSTSRSVPFHQLVDGIPRSPFLDPALVRQALAYKPRQGDIVLVTYPKSGSHWVQQIIQLILNHGEIQLPISSEMAKRTPLLENQGTRWLDDVPPPRTIRTHLQKLRDNFSEEAKYIYLARSPWDCCISFYHTVKSLPKYRFQDGTFENFVDAFLTEDFGYDNYFEHVSCGYEHRDRSNVFFLAYEELKTDTSNVVLRLAYFIGEDYGKTVEENDDVFERILEKCSFEYMRRVFGMDASRYANVLTSYCDFPQNSAAEDVRESTGPLFSVRKGRARGWRDYYTHEQMQRMRLRLEQTCKNLSKIWEPK
ncbi:salivary sulfotransferase, putative [Ixodes scapularis]|uniref:Salivary sulfotransferase, putative n=1 Tax=Ixodes scapularis TaxID=6945 RepID=B7Q6M5_IXOSC|nr:salivary sulfotransferase, putative [Ixodes scapularis]|eukprot:XP_002403167.1 salivary sulfotransferase, putative [Ixodes scapularis]